jgi:hypothetical protein
MKVPVPVHSKKFSTETIKSEQQWSIDARMKSIVRIKLHEMHPYCIHNQSKLDQRKKGTELPRLLHVEARIEQCRQARQGRARRRPGPADHCRPSGLQVLKTLILNRCRPARPLSHQPAA